MAFLFFDCFDLESGRIKLSRPWLAEVSLELGTFDGYNTYNDDIMMPEEAECLCVWWTVNTLVKLKAFVQRKINIEACVVTVNNEDFRVVVLVFNVEYFNDLLSRILNDDRVINRNVILIGDMKC